MLSTSFTIFTALSQNEFEICPNLGDGINIVNAFHDYNCTSSFIAFREDTSRIVIIILIYINSQCTKRYHTFSGKIREKCNVLIVNAVIKMNNWQRGKKGKKVLGCVRI